jgi:hypothetical protein
MIMAKVLTPGHKYIASNFEDSDNGQTIQFIEKQATEDNSGLVTIHDGTTNEELLLILIDRITFLNNKFPCKENACAITSLQQGLHWLYARTDARIKQGVEGLNVSHETAAKLSVLDDGPGGSDPTKPRGKYP